MLVLAADGTSLGSSYGVIGYERLSNPPDISTAAENTWVLLFEQPGGAGSPGAFLWRNADSGQARECYQQPFYLRFPDQGCSGTPIIYSYMLPNGFACKNGTRLLAASGPAMINASYQSYSTSSGCFNTSGVIPSALQITDIGPATNIGAPLQFLPQ